MLSRRWALFALAVVLLAYACWWLGEWQWHRLSARKEVNAIVRTNETAPPAPVSDVLAAPGAPLDEHSEWRTVTATGTYDVTHTVIVRYRETDHGQSGVDVVVPLTTSGGTSVLVDRGFFETAAMPQSASDVPAPPPGLVTVTGYARVDGTGTSTAVDKQSTRAISSSTISAALGLTAYGGFVQLTGETPAPASAMVPNALPDLSNGPHFFYALQWWFFAILAVFGFLYLAYDERMRGPRGGREGAPAKVKKVRQTNVPAAYQRPRDKPPSTGNITPETNDAADDSRKAAARPNSAGSP